MLNHKANTSLAFVCKNVQGACWGLRGQDEVGLGGPGTVLASFIPRPPTPLWSPPVCPTPHTTVYFVAR